MASELRPIRLKRSLSLLEAFMLGLGPTIGPTIFIVPRTAVEIAGPSAVFAFLLAGVITLLTALNYAEMSSAVPEAGGGYSFANRAFGGTLAFASGWFMWMGNVAYMALSATTFGLAMNHLAPALPPTIVASAVITLFTVVNFIGSKEAGRVQVALTTLVLATLTAFVVRGVFSVDASRYPPPASIELLPVFTAVGYVYSVYIGFETIANASEEVRRASVIVPKAMLLTIFTTMALFPLILTVLVGVMPKDEIVAAKAPLLVAASRLFGDAGGAVMAAGAIVASLASLNAAIIASSRTAYALGRDRHLPRGLLSLHPRFRTPYVGLSASMVAAFLFTYMADIDLMVYVTDFGYLMGLAVINPAAILLRKKVAFVRRPFRLALYPLVPIAATATSIAVIPTIHPASLLLGGVITAAGLGASVLYRGLVCRAPRTPQKTVSA